MQKGHITLSLEDDLLKEVDALSQSEHRDRSAIICECILRCLHPAPPPNQPQPSGDLPDALKTRIDSLYKWRVQCAIEAEKHQNNFWLLTIPPLAVNAGYGCGLFGLIHAPVFVTLIHFISSMLMVVEKQRPQERVFTALEKAALELDQLLRKMQEDWQAGVAVGQDPTRLLALILAAADKEEERIAKYIADAESFLKESSLGRRLKGVAAKGFAALRGS
jgi:hypothetical protein